uniref:Ribonuclease H-like domain-containing protein n=1 Tax=Tanacetum cinerariifolium TaxID=118510 RepID=A0A6L2NLC9_TANCI|nr:ribonuclease H-like domain-containing protein [Tanacetum cinerariifolium]
MQKVKKEKGDIQGEQDSNPEPHPHQPFITKRSTSVPLGLFCLKTNDLNDDERDNRDKGCINSSSAEPAVDYASADIVPAVAPNASTSSKSTNTSRNVNTKYDSTDLLGSINAEGGVDEDGAAPYNDENISEGEEFDIYYLDFLLQHNSNKDRTVDGQSVRSSNRKFAMPHKFDDYVIDDLGKLKYFLGIEVVKNEHGICLSQRKYRLELLSEFGMLACKPSKVPLYVSKTKNKHVKLVECDDRFLENITGYQKLVGKLIYLTITKPDISYVVHKLSQVMHAPKLANMKSAFKVLRYIKHSPRKGIQYAKSDNFQVTAYVDSDWAKCTATTKSVIGYAVYLGDCLVS